MGYRVGFGRAVAAAAMAVVSAGVIGSAEVRADDFASILARVGGGGSSSAGSNNSSRTARAARLSRQASAAPSRGGLAGPATTAPLPQGPVVLVVSLSAQRLSVYSAGKLVETTPISTGTASDPTPSGVFAVIEKAERHFSNLYNGAPMPNMQRLTMSGVALHSGYVTGRPASHGCVRLPHAYSQRLFKMTKLGARVIISDDNPTPVEIDTLQIKAPGQSAQGTQVAAVGAEIVTGSVVRTATDASPGDAGALPLLAPPADKSIDPRTGKPKGPYSLQRDEVLRAAPVSILVSRAESRVYVRHMFEPVFDMPITISEPARPLGTHVYTLNDIGGDGAGQRWSAVSVKLVPRRVAAIRVLTGKHRAARGPAPVAIPDQGGASTSAEAVGRFTLPPQIAARVAPLLRPGASLVVTDLPLSKRTQTGWTDVIVSP